MQILSLPHRKGDLMLPIRCRFSKHYQFWCRYRSTVGRIRGRPFRGIARLCRITWTSWLDGGIADAQLLHVPVELSLELVAIVCTNCVDPKRELLHHMVDEVDGAAPGVTRIDLQVPGCGCRRRSRCIGTA